MATPLEIRVNQKNHLRSLLKIKKENGTNHVLGLEEEILAVIAIMEQEDIAWVEKVIGITAIPL